MALVHSKNAVLIIDGVTISSYTNGVTFTRSIDSHDTTTHGLSAKRYQTGLTDATASVEGFYDSTAMTGPSAKFKSIIAGDTSVVLKWRPEGTGSGKPEAEVSVIVTSYEETAPVADMVMWSAELQCTGTIDDTAQ